MNIILRQRINKPSKGILLLNFIVIMVALISCSGDRPKETGKETPKALKDKTLDVSYGRSSGNVVDGLYDELESNSTELKKIKDDIEENNTGASRLQEELDTYKGKSIGYYTAAKSMAHGISDSLLKARIIKLISSSQKSFDGKTSALDLLSGNMAANNLNIKDYYTILKIARTLPVIEKYQDDNLPAVRTYDEFVAGQRKLEQRIDSLTPKR